MFAFQSKESPRRRYGVGSFSLLLVTAWLIGQAAFARPLVVVTLPDIATIVHAISGETAEIAVVMPPGSDAHDFRLSAQQIERYEQAALIVYYASRFLGFEALLKAALRDKPSVDWDDYAAYGATFRDYPDFPRNPHGAWLRLDNALAIARAVTAKLEALGLPREALRARLSQFETECAAFEAAAARLVRENGLTGHPLLAVIPGVCDLIANFGLPVGGVLMAEGSGTTSGPRLREAVERLRAGEWAAIVCPLSLREAKQGAVARQLASDSGAPIVYVHFLDAQLGRDTYLSQRAEELAALAPIKGGAPHSVAKTSARKQQGLTLAGLYVAAFFLGFMLGRRRKAPSGPYCGAGIFADD